MSRSGPYAILVALLENESSVRNVFLEKTLLVSDFVYLLSVKKRIRMICSKKI